MRDTARSTVARTPATQVMSESRTCGGLAHRLIAQHVIQQCCAPAGSPGVDDVLAILIENVRGGTVNPEIGESWNTVDDLPRSVASHIPSQALSMLSEAVRLSPSMVAPALYRLPLPSQ